MKQIKELTLAQAAKELGLRRNFLRTAIQDGELEARQAKISGGFMYLVTPEALEKFALAQGIPFKGLIKYLDKSDASQKPETGKTPLKVLAEKSEASLEQLEQKTREEVASTLTSLRKSDASLRLVQKEDRPGEHDLRQAEEELAAAQAEMTISLAAYKKAAEELEAKEAENSKEEVAKAVDGLLRVYPVLEQKMDSLVERVSEVQNQLRGMQKGVHQHMSKMEGSLLRYNQGLTGAVQDVRKSVSEVSQNQTEMRTSHMLTQKMVLDIRDMSGRMNQHTQSIKESLEEVAASQDDSSRTTRATQQKLTLLQENLHEIQESMREVDKSLQWIAKWRKKTALEMAEREKSRGLKGFWSRLFGGGSPALKKY